MKKWIFIFLTTFICLSLWGCGVFGRASSPEPSAEPSVSEQPTPEPSPQPVVVKIGTVHDIDTFLNIRSGPGTAYDILGKAQNGDRFTVLTEFYNQSWHQIDYNGGIAYIHADYLTITEETVTEEPQQSEGPSEEPSASPSGEA